MLEHLALGSDKHALAGDLLEEFRHRRSVGWYWRQVLMAIFVGFSKELGRQWRAACFAVVWTIASGIALRLLYYSTQFRSMFGWALRHNWPESGVLSVILETSPQVLMWWLGLVLYLVMMRNFGARRIQRGLLVCFFFVSLETGFYLSGLGQVIRDMPRQWIRLGHWMPSFVSLFLSFWVTLPSGAIKRSATMRISG
jgi:hypothetical protein